MTKTNYAGIDYSGPGSKTNRSSETGIRYGIIPSNALNQDALEDVYQNGTDEDYESHIESIKASLKSCLKEFGLEDAAEDAFDAISDSIGDRYSPCGDCTRYSYDSDGYKLQIASDGDVWVFESKYFTYAQFCSPCAPGACYLKSPLESPSEANKCYCLGPDWFDKESPCPYPVYSVETGLPV